MREIEIFREKFDRIDILRGFAATIVMVYHIVLIGNFEAFPKSWPFNLVWNGWMGIDLFFVISGFVITLSLKKEDFTNVRKARIKFMKRRWFRIAPLYYFTIAIFIAFLQPHLLFLSAKALLAHFGTHVFFLHNLIPQTHGSIVGPNWTVALEMQFYILMAIIFKKLFVGSKTKMIIAMVASAWTWRFITTLFFIPGASNSNNQFIFSNFLPGTLDEFSVGILIALLWVENSEKDNVVSGMMKRSFINFAVFFALFITIFSSNLYLLQIINYWSSTAMIVFFKTSLAVSFGLLLLATITLPLRNTMIESPFKYLGKISYGIYLWHIIVLSTILDRIPWLVGYKLLFIVSGITLVLSVMSYHLIELPMIQRGKMRQGKSVE